MLEFIFMLTHGDRTVSNALQVYGEIQDTGLRYVGFKDIGLPFDQLHELTERIHAGGQEVMLEVVSEHRDDELRSAEAALHLGVDYLLGGTHVQEVSALLKGSGVRYFPFPGTIVGHPSLLRGTHDEIVASAAHLSSLEGVHGLDLLAYRFDGDVETLVEAVVQAVEVPVVAAGSIVRTAQISALAERGVWGFTVGSAVFEGKFGTGLRSQVESLLATTQAVGADPVQASGQ